MMALKKGYLLASAPLLVEPDVLSKRIIPNRKFIHISHNHGISNVESDQKNALGLSASTNPTIC